MSIISVRMRMGLVGALIQGRIILAILLPRLSLLRRKLSLLFCSFIGWLCANAWMGYRSGYSAAKMPNDLAAGFAITAGIPIPPIPTTFIPGTSPASALLG
jgi:hypothetical protein